MRLQHWECLKGSSTKSRQTQPDSSPDDTIANLESSHSAAYLDNLTRNVFADHGWIFHREEVISNHLNHCINWVDGYRAILNYNLIVPWRVLRC